MSEDTSDSFADQSFDPKADAQKSLIEAIETCPIGVYTHRNGGQYVVFNHSVDEATHVLLVHYFSLERHTRWTRSIANFVEPVDGVPRFLWTREATDPELRATRSVIGRLPSARSGR